MVWLPDGEKKFEDNFSRFRKISACDIGPTDRQPSSDGRDRAVHTRRAVKKIKQSAVCCTKMHSIHYGGVMTDILLTRTGSLLSTSALWQAKLTFILFFQISKKLFWISEKKFVISEVLTH